MNEKELKEFFENEELIKSMLTSSFIEDFYVNNIGPVYSLKECLECADEEILNSIYTYHKYVISENLKKNPTNQEKIDILEKEIKKSFLEYLSHMHKEEKDILEEIIKYKKTEIYNETLLGCGFMFGFKENNKTVYIVPNELIKIYIEYKNSDDSKRLDYEKANLYIVSYMLMNGMLKKDFVEELLIEYYGLNISKKEIKEILDSDFSKYKNNYYSLLPNNKELESIKEELFEIKEEQTIKKLNEVELLSYIDMVHDITEKLPKIFKNGDNEKIFDSFMSRCFITYETIDELLSFFEVNKSQKKQLKELLETYHSNFRYWFFNGKTIDELDKEIFVENILICGKPKFDGLKNCLKNCDENVLEIISENYDTEDIEDLKVIIIDKFKEKIQKFNKIQISIIIDNNYDIVPNCIDITWFKLGLLYFYKENDTIKYMVPKEILDIMKESIYTKDNETYVRNLIMCYINMNGVIEKEKLQQLLNENHNIDISIKDLDKYMYKLDISIIDNYYTCIEDCRKKDIKEIMGLKNKFNKYKIADLEQDDLEDEFKYKLLDFMEQEFPINQDTEEVYETLKLMSKYGSLNEEIIEAIFEEAKVSVNKKQIKNILQLYKDYKKHISVWILNGYSVNEANELKSVKNEKIGRNEPCPCGSGKKYKKCCGK